MMTRVKPALAALMLLAAACATESETPPEIPADALPAGTSLGSGTIEGRAVFLGDVPEAEMIDMRSDSACHRKRPDGAGRENLVLNPDKSLRNVLVHVVGGAGGFFAPPESPVVLDQQGCVYQPHVVGIQVGQPLTIVNSDPTLHNVHSVSKANKPFNFGMAVEGQKSTRYFHAEEVTVKLKCDVHPWMSSYVGVFSHPFFAVTGDAGGFAIDGLAAGEYVVEAWHESLGPIRKTVTVTADQPASVNFEFSG